MTAQEMITTLRICGRAPGFEEKGCKDCPRREACVHEVRTALIMQEAADLLERYYEEATTITLIAERLPYTEGYRLYNPLYPQQSVAYVDTLEEAERPGYKIICAE